MLKITLISGSIVDPLCMWFIKVYVQNIIHCYALDHPPEVLYKAIDSADLDHLL